jgi:hypothetical protein
MTHCVKCGFELEDAGTACSNCGWDKEASRGGVLRKRPDGGSLIGFGGCGIVLGVIFSLIGMFPSGGTYVGYGVTQPTYHFGWALIGGALLNVGLLVLLAGFIVRALWFLPGPEHKPVPEARVPRRPQSPALSPLTRPGSEGAQI